jgi:hypothetical protein
MAKALVPDDEGFWALLERGEEPFLLPLAVAEEAERDSDQPYRLPAPIADRVALEAYHRVQAVLGRQRRQPRGRLLGPDGHYDHLPLLLVDLPDEDLEVLDGALQAFNRALAGQEPDLTELMVDLDGWGAWDMTPANMVGSYSRLLAVLTLPPDDDSRRLVDRLTTTAAGADLVLTVTEEAAYQRLATRLNLLLADGDPITRYLY